MLKNVKGFEKLIVVFLMLLICPIASIKSLIHALNRNHYNTIVMVNFCSRISCMDCEEVFIDEIKDE